MNSWTRVRLVALMAITLPVQAAEVSLQTGFHATVGEAVAVDNGGVAYSYQVRGATTLTMEGATHALSIDCVGLDVTDAAQATTGVGRCVWRDADDHQLMLSVQTAEGRNR